MAKIEIHGNVGKDGAVISGDYARFSVGENTKVKGERVTTWYTIFLRGDGFEKTAKRIKQGKRVKVRGSLRMEINSKNPERIDATVSSSGWDVDILEAYEAEADTDAEEDATPAPRVTKAAAKPSKAARKDDF